MPAAHHWSIYEGSCSTLLPSPSTVAHFAEDIVALGLARIEAHYFSNKIFLPENSLLENANRLRSIPGIIVQGRYDIVCPIVSADDLHCSGRKRNTSSYPTPGIRLGTGHQRTTGGGDGRLSAAARERGLGTRLRDEGRGISSRRAFHGNCGICCPCGIHGSSHERAR